MSQPLVVTIPHRLGRTEAVRRIRDGIQWARARYGTLINISREDWTDDGLAFRVGVLGQSAEGTVAVTDDAAMLSVQLPWLLARFAAKAQAVLQQQGHLMLEKK